jgi:hypothetical protein
LCDILHLEGRKISTNKYEGCQPKKFEIPCLTRCDTEIFSYIECLLAVLALKGVVGFVAEAVTPSCTFGVELGPAFATRIHRLVGMSLLVVNLSGKRYLFSQTRITKKLMNIHAEVVTRVQKCSALHRGRSSKAIKTFAICEEIILRLHFLHLN